jgi:hypothetical protein
VGEETGVNLPGSLDRVAGKRGILVGEYRKRVDLAEQLASIIAANLEELGKAIVGRVALVEDIGGDEIPVDIPPETWVRIAHVNPEVLGEGYYYVIVDPKSLNILLASVSASTRLSSAKTVGAHQPLVTVPLEAPHPLSIAANVVSLRIVLRPLIALHVEKEVENLVALSKASGGLGAGPPQRQAAKVLASLEPSAPTVPPDPGSPVVIPDPGVLEALLVQYMEGVLLGGLAVMDRLYVAGGRAVPIRLPWSVLVKHMLVTGTTGSGKTSLVKNMMLDAARSGDSVHVAVLDANSDYVAGLLPGYIPGEKVDEQTALVMRLYGVSAERSTPVIHDGLSGIVVIPCINCYKPDDYRKAAEDYVEYIEKATSKSYEKHGCSLELGNPRDEEDFIYSVNARLSCDIGEKKARLYIAPRSIVIKDLAELAQLDPYMTSRARETLRILVRMHNPITIRRALDIIRKSKGQELRAHPETLRNLENRLQVLNEIGVVKVGGSQAENLDYGSLASNMERFGLNVAVLDLGYAAQRAPESVDPQSVKVLLGYRLLTSLAKFMEEAEKPMYVMLVIDEAHLFFPHRGGEYAELLRASIERLARLGRSRGIAIVFSTHRETDVSPIIATLANTKIYFRTDKKTAEELPLPAEYKRRLPYYRDHAAVVTSYAVRGGYIGIINAPPLIGHRTA